MDSIDDDTKVQKVVQGVEDEEEESSQTIEVPVVKQMLFRFNKPVKAKFNSAVYEEI